MTTEKVPIVDKNGDLAWVMPDEARERAGPVVEGATAAPVLLGIAERCGIEMPITEQVAAVVGGDATPAAAVEALLARAPAAEYESGQGWE